MYYPSSKSLYQKQYKSKQKKISNFQCLKFWEDMPVPAHSTGERSDIWKEINRAEEQRARWVIAISILLRWQSAQRLARFAPHCRIEGDPANNQPKNILTKSYGKPAMRSGCEASLRALCCLWQHGPDRVGKLSQRALCSFAWYKYLYDRLLLNQKLKS